ncbi:MAG: hypothetical protein Q8O15_09250 [Rectinemataceae bacterium]|nr:hypothetical protein [Rectinemataceae bacterium]
MKGYELFPGVGVGFACSMPALEAIHRRAASELAASTLPSPGGNKAGDSMGEAQTAGPPMLIEGGPYRGCWLESTGSISAEILSRFLPGLAADTFTLFARHMRADGLMPYKILPSGAAYRQIQMVTPLARSVWNHYSLNGGNKAFLAEMYGAMARFDEWLAAHRDTRKTGCVEAFCTFDTGHDLSPRFWHVPDTCFGEDAARFDPESPLLPFLAPDLTANVACQRRYLALMARELGDEARARDWESAAAASTESLMRHCFDPADGFFYDRDRSGNFVRIQSDVLLRVLACEIGDDGLFESSLCRYLLNTRKFFSRYPLTSIALDDPRFDPASDYNSWGGAVNFLSLVRAPAAFELHGRHVELTWIMQPILSAALRFTRFPQCLSPWTGDEGFTEGYTPTMLCLLDYIERLCGIMPRPEGRLWFTGLLPSCLSGVQASGTGIVGGIQGASSAGISGGSSADGAFTTYAREIDGSTFTLCNSDSGCEILCDGNALARFPRGIRLVTDRSGALTGITGMSLQPVSGNLAFMGVEYPFTIRGNEEQVFVEGRFATMRDPGIVAICHG